MTDQELRRGVLLLRAEEAIYNLLKLTPEPSRYAVAEHKQYHEARQVMLDLHEEVTRDLEAPR